MISLTTVTQWSKPHHWNIRCRAVVQILAIAVILEQHSDTKL